MYTTSVSSPSATPVTQIPKEIPKGTIFQAWGAGNFGSRLPVPGFQKEAAALSALFQKRGAAALLTIFLERRSRGSYGSFAFFPE